MNFEDKELDKLPPSRGEFSLKAKVIEPRMATLPG